jgi:hypothetical protein
MPPALEHGWLLVDHRHRVDAVRRVIHALDARQALVFMNFQQRLKVRSRESSLHCIARGKGAQADDLLLARSVTPPEFPGVQIDRCSFLHIEPPLLRFMLSAHGS